MKTALITGITGQDGSYLARLLLDHGYQVHGLVRRASYHNTSRIDDILPRITLHHGDVTDGLNIVRVLEKSKPDEIYHLAAQSHVGLSFETPEYTANADGIGTLRLLEGMRALGIERSAKFYQASTSELYGGLQTAPMNENTPFNPRSPYAAAKLYAYHITVNYREAYGMFACNGILFNHESPLRGETFVTKKITKAVARIRLGFQKTLYLGALHSKRDWGHARDYVEAMHLMLQQPVPDDYVIATGQCATVAEFTEKAFKCVGIDIEWVGQGVNEVGIDKADKSVLVRIDPAYYRPTEVPYLQGDATKARIKLGWIPKTSLDDLIREMVEHDLLTDR